MMIDTGTYLEVPPQLDLNTEEDLHLFVLFEGKRKSCFVAQGSSQEDEGNDFIMNELKRSF